MTTQPLRPPLPPHLQPTAKAPSTAQSSPLSARADNKPAPSRSSSHVRPVTQKQNVTKVDYTSDTATLSLIRRVLSPQTGHATDQRSTPRPIEDLLPPLTSLNAVDVQLYAIIAIVLRDFVYVWYSKITPDHVFVEEVLQIVAHTTRAIEQRLRRIDIESLVLDEIPALLVDHVHSYYAANENLTTSPYGLEPAQLYHALNPHPALSPVPELDNPESCAEQARNETVYRQLLVQGALAVLLPTEDLENACLRALVGDIIADLILGQGVSARVCEGWFIHDAITKTAGIINSRIEARATGEAIEVGTRSRLEQYGLLTSRDEDEKHHSSKGRQSPISAVFWRLLQYGYLVSLFIRFVFLGLSQARYLPPRFQNLHHSFAPENEAKLEQTPTPSSTLPMHVESRTRPILHYRLFALISTILDLATRMPWLAGFLSICRHFTISGPGRLGRTDSMLDKFLGSAIRTHVLPPSILPPILLNLRIALFPGNARGPNAAEPPNEAEKLRMRRRCAEAVLSLVPPTLSRLYFNVGGDQEGEEDMIKQVEDILDVFGNAYMNKHLVYNVLELVVVRLVPEMMDSTPSELLGERGVG